MATLRKRKAVGKASNAWLNKEEESKVEDMKAGDQKMTLHEEDKLPASPSSWSFIEDLMQPEEGQGLTGDLVSLKGACGGGNKGAKEGAGFKMRLRFKGKETQGGKAGNRTNQNAATKGKIGRAAPTRGCPTPSKAENKTSKVREVNGTTMEGTRAGKTGKGKAKESLKKSSDAMNTGRVPENPTKDLSNESEKGSKNTEEGSKTTRKGSKKTEKVPKKPGRGSNKTVANSKKFEDPSKETDEIEKVGIDKTPKEVKKAKELEKVGKKAWIEAMKAQGVRKRTAPKMIQKLKVESKASAVGRPNLPPLPEEADLFMPQIKGKKLEQCCTELLMLLEELEVGQSFNLQQMSVLLEGSDERKLLLICEVLEALAMVRRTGSDLEWLGRDLVDEQLVRLHQDALEQDVLQQIRLGCDGGMEKDEGEDTGTIKRHLSNLQLTQKLVMIFLAAPDPRTLTLSVACKVIYAGFKQPVVAQSWLSEIANVLVALGLLRYFLFLNLSFSMMLWRLDGI